ncbi:MAG: hypothetical protein COB12_06715 [Flavobacterium sp.]|nr:MAG: hypothetical protein COB12_06715 [Flavobacterium sp.]
MKPVYLLFIVLVTACSSVKYKSSPTKKLPELGTIGVFTNFLLKKEQQTKTVVSLSDPIRLHFEEIQISKRQIIPNKDSLQAPKKDSTLISFEILDKVALVGQLNRDKELLKYLLKTTHYKIVTKVTMQFSKELLTDIQKADEIYLLQNKQKTLSLELRKNNKPFQVIEFTDGNIISFKALEFCWGQNKRRDIEIFNLVPNGSSCGEDTYTSVKKVKKKNEFKF